MEVFLTDLQAYNEGCLYGIWITLPLTPFELSQAISEVLNEGEYICETEDHEEYFITDYEADISIDEYDDIYKLNELAEILADYSDDDLLKLRFLSHEGYDEREVIERGIDSYDVEIHDYSSDISFTDVYELLAQDLVDEGCFGVIPEHLESYIDYEAIGRDLAYDYVEFEHGVVARIM